MGIKRPNIVLIWSRGFNANMFGKGRYFGLVGTKLNVAIGVLAGLDFLLFGYDQGVMGGLLDLPSFVRKWRRGKTALPLF